MKQADHWFAERLETFPHSNEVKAYVMGVLRKFVVTPADDMSKESIVLAFANAKETGDFAKFQRLGDWVLWVRSFAPQHIERDIIVVETVGRLSYDACYRIMQRQWKVYEELADSLPSVAMWVNRKLFTPRV